MALNRRNTQLVKGQTGDKSDPYPQDQVQDLHSKFDIYKRDQIIKILYQDFYKLKHGQEFDSERFKLEEEIQGYLEENRISDFEDSSAKTPSQLDIFTSLDPSLFIPEASLINQDTPQLDKRALPLALDDREI